jgi:hypothetical protein
MKESTDMLCSSVYDIILNMIDSNIDKDKKIEIAEKVYNNLKSIFDNLNVNINCLVKIINEMKN